jgi:hypothetical protein
MAERKNEDFMLRSLRKKPRMGKGMDVVVLAVEELPAE